MILIIIKYNILKKQIDLKNGSEKKGVVLIRLVSTANTGTFFVKKKNPKKPTKKLSFKKYDPKIRQHVEFKEEKIK